MSHQKHFFNKWSQSDLIHGKVFGEGGIILPLYPCMYLVDRQRRKKRKLLRRPSRWDGNCFGGEGRNLESQLNFHPNHERKVLFLCFLVLPADSLSVKKIR